MFDITGSRRGGSGVMGGMGRYEGSGKELGAKEG